ncbi:MAG: hypothetical protein ACKVP5_11245 [Aestuariivirga sp.]
MLARLAALALSAAAIPAQAGSIETNFELVGCFGIRCHGGGGGNAWITHEKLYNKKLTKKQAYRVCKNRYPVMSDIIVFKISKGWECRIRRP